MDFQSLMSTADKNARKASQTIESDAKKQLEAEKRLRLAMQQKKADRENEALRRREEERKRNFTIPKREADKPGVNQNALKAYYEKKDQEKREKDKQAEIDRERLMRLRVQANGGKATKKIGKHFGMDAVNVQIRFGGNNEHIETLQKRKLKEEDDAEQEADKYRNGVYKALQAKKKNEERLRGTVTGPHRVATSKTNSLAGLCSRHERTRDTFSPPKDLKKPSEEKKDAEKKKVQYAAPVDFKSLMAAASNLSQGKKVDLKQFQPKPLKPPSSSSHSTSSSSSRPSSSRSVNGSSKPSDPSRDKNREQERMREKMKEKERAMAKEKEMMRKKKLEGGKERPKTQAPTTQNHGSQKPIPKPQARVEKLSSIQSVDMFAQSNPVANDKKKETKGGRFQKGPTPPPMIPAAVPGKKYLPGDVRYKAMYGSAGNVSSSNGAGSSSNGQQSSSSSNNRISNNREIERQREKEREKMRQLKRMKQEKEDREMERRAKIRKIEKSRPDDNRRYENRREQELREQQLREKYKKSKGRREERSERGGGSFFRGGDDNSDEEAEDYYEEEDDYDSDMDDFIDDTEVDMDGMSRKEFEETLKMVNRKYDKDKWSRREKMISERDMVSDFRRIQTEENYSKRAGFMEDLREATKGRSVRL